MAQHLPDVPNVPPNTTSTYEMLLATLAQSAPPDVPEEQLVLAFAESLPSGEQADFLAWWHHQKSAQQPADVQPETSPACSEEPLPQAVPSVPRALESTRPSHTHQPLLSQARMSTPATDAEGALPRITRRQALLLLAGAGVTITGLGAWWKLSQKEAHVTGPMVTYLGHTDAVEAVAWSPDGKRIASASGDKTVQVWDATTGGHAFTYHGHTSMVDAVAWSPDGKRIASTVSIKMGQDQWMHPCRCGMPRREATSSPIVGMLAGLLLK